MKNHYIICFYSFLYYFPNFIQGSLQIFEPIWDLLEKIFVVYLSWPRSWLDSLYDMAIYSEVNRSKGQVCVYAYS